ncbi:hypothetical protein EUX98_g71 [Antrodiella citrinella]|uniref:Uncharacterized protein n=1 Tax=Antrodiella citrinella TaxID=2447956 RepID=A0A4S4N4V2_9APHY|nr:hypothetical protein EUX98_g71 [Antrodiella citrinella]
MYSDSEVRNGQLAPPPPPPHLIRPMSPVPISPNVVHLILQYIAPPSQLLLPVPPFLLSKPLLQRHHFLAISPSDPHEYLCWPTDLSSSLNTIHLLESLPRPIDDDEPIPYPVQYTSDDEYSCAHVHITPSGEDGIRLVFQWDEHDGWKYHDARLMPFPAASTPSLLEALGSVSSGLRLRVPDVHDEHNSYGFDNDVSGTNDDDDYWNAYGAQDMDTGSPGPLAFSAKDTDGATEDAYWDRYTSVHGTADSTRPSPLPIQRKNYPTLEESSIDPDSPHPLPVPVRVVEEDATQEALPIPHSSLSQAINGNISRSPWDPASPQTLARLLADISPRHSPAVVSQTDDDDDDEERVSPVFDSSSTDELQTPSPSIGLGLTEDGHALVSPTADGNVVVEEEDEGSSAEFDETEYALRDSIRGLYSLWKVSRRKGTTHETDRDAFMRVVHEVVNQ